MRLLDQKRKQKPLKAVNIIGGKYVTKEKRFRFLSVFLKQTLTGDKKKLNNRKMEALHIMHRSIISYLYVDFPDYA